jgi:hypothetical protein
MIGDKTEQSAAVDLPRILVMTKGRPIAPQCR